MIPCILTFCIIDYVCSLVATFSYLHLSEEKIFGKASVESSEILFSRASPVTWFLQGLWLDNAKTCVKIILA